MSYHEIRLMAAQPTKENPIMESGNYWCDLCDRGFAMSEILNEHLKNHVRCNIDGCHVEGNAKFIEDHVKLQHTTGIYERFKNIASEEDIQRWREERKRRYPTKENVELRQMAQAAKQKRGERLDAPNNRFGKRGHNQRHNNGNKRGNFNDRNKRRRRTQPAPIVVQSQPAQCSDSDDSNHSMPRFRGTSQLADYRRMDKPKNALSGLLGMYESSSESEDDDEDTQISVTVPVVTDAIDEKKVNPEADLIDTSCPIEKLVECETVDAGGDDNYDSEDMPMETAIERTTDEFPLHKPIVSDESSSSKPHERKQPREMAKNKATTSNSNASVTRNLAHTTKNYRRLKQNTFLEKLLVNEIRHERNMLLQCVRYVIEENFFDKNEVN